MKSKLLFVTLVAALLFVSCAEGQPSKSGAVKVKCTEVQSANADIISVSYPGKVVALADVNLSFRVAGVIDRVVVVEGEFVKEGQVVAYLDSRDYKLQLEATQAEYNSIKGEADRIIAMYEDGTISQNDYEKAVNGVKQITAKLAAHRNAYEDTALKAPFDGYPQRINFERGEALSAGMPVMKFVSSALPEIVVNIPVKEYLRRGDLLSAVATVSSLPDQQIELEMVGFSHKANLNQLYQTRFKVLSSDQTLPSLGVSAMVTLNYSSSSTLSQVIVPFSAVVEHNGASYVWKIVDGKSQLAKVNVVAINRDGTSILSGDISSGDVVITAGTNTIKEGVEVSPIAAPSKSNVGNIL